MAQPDFLSAAGCEPSTAIEPPEWEREMVGAELPAGRAGRVRADARAGRQGGRRMTAGAQPFVGVLRRLLGDGEGST